MVISKLFICNTMASIAFASVVCWDGTWCQDAVLSLTWYSSLIGICGCLGPLIYLWSLFENAENPLDRHQKPTCMNEQAFLCTVYGHPKNVSDACRSVKTRAQLGRQRFRDAAVGCVVPSCTFENTFTCVAPPVKLFKGRASGRQLRLSLSNAVTFIVTAVSFPYRVWGCINVTHASFEHPCLIADLPVCAHWLHMMYPQ